MVKSTFNNDIAPPTKFAVLWIYEMFSDSMWRELLQVHSAPPLDAVLLANNALPLIFWLAEKINIPPPSPQGAVRLVHPETLSAQ